MLWAASGFLRLIYVQDMEDRLVGELVSVGLGAKEARVYLAALKFGPATAQDIAVKSLVNRPTTYTMIESLTKRGLMSQVQKGKKRFFVANKPGRLVAHLEQQERNIRDQRIKLSSSLENLFKNFGPTKQSQVEVFEDLSSLTHHQNDLLLEAAKVREVVTITSVDSKENAGARVSMEPIWRRLYDSGVLVRCLYAGSEDRPLHGTVTGPRWESKNVDKKKFPLEGEITICGDIVTMLSGEDSVFGLSIRNRSMANLLRQVFNLVWLGVGE
ncbi:hypothetical protein A2480_00580 [Candidatus Uhrbacteria bacterium RIFOXYC2_FULL_47_19]|uniref:Transcription regulator TrmB N-terminal domain-containing protein n=1 Tax=Candidatus Uhrbacteria bacterium RIFOXYC2_FULL_47_19 TaxID=1802424 RepID=A0A1F7WCQ5_9BACT|nr:MAG: hypothetical protein A2480_00580 [Candidatus Uhrbacteria bacterium RIFOXYC2_FULL_47_19]HCC21952.1 hypothetical protein [Candidatus Uhrbacteria bacterium]